MASFHLPINFSIYRSLFLSYVSIKIILSGKKTQTFIPMEPTGNSADSSDRKTGKKIVASSATVKPNGKSIASSAIVKTDVSSTVPVKPNVATALSSAHADQVMLFRDVSFGPREAELRFRLIHFWEARNPLTNGHELSIIHSLPAMLMLLFSSIPESFSPLNRNCSPSLQFDFYFIFSVEFDSYDEFLVVNGISKLIRSTYVEKRITIFHLISP
ncbi:hypothetical protein IGI04_036213 [Brassica rapa subsp. trilocularis]|uniref:Uncharacterized protein n=1 Tax=Brassica rapa subsp. trilocularis TaxID=1813537 RepID=A0ABQ7LDY9_BRACM|nr:hypothetical protein IGI04_036213 [Brassica rapa subsp. trilocularis]